MKKNPTPLIIISDAPSASTGLGRICRDLATRLCGMKSEDEDSTAGRLPQFRVATLGYGGPGSSKFPFPQFHTEGMGDDWVIPCLPQVCDDFFRGERGIILTIWDLCRLTWLAQPRLFYELTEHLPGLQAWAKKRDFELWGYVPIDGSGPQDKLTTPIGATLLGFDRLLAYGPFGEAVIRRTIGDEEADKRHLTWLPHGIDSDVFFPMDRKNCRKVFFKHTGALPMVPMDKMPPIEPSDVLIGIVSTNQARKDFGMAIEACALLAQRRKIKLWIHTDIAERHWSIPALLNDYGLLHNTFLSFGYLADEQMAEAYSACDLSFGIGPEGFGYPLMESQFCGTPVVTGSYAGGGDIVPHHLQVTPLGYRLDTVYATVRPVYESWRWAALADTLVGKRVNRDSQYDWELLWPRWEAYLREAVQL